MSSSPTNHSTGDTPHDDAHGHLADRLASESPDPGQDHKDDQAPIHRAAQAFKELLADDNVSLSSLTSDNDTDRTPPPLPDDYEFIEEIGRGGMGVVYKATQKSLGRIVAIKVLHPTTRQLSEASKRFEREARMLARLRHPNIVTVYEVGTMDDHVYLVMEWIEGRPLSEIIDEGALDGKRTVSLLRQVTGAVGYVHEHGLVHRDLKPANILVDDQDVAYVTDFGLAVDLEGASGLTLTGQIIGTPAYMSPEQARGATDDVNELSDIYSLGVVMYECLSGRRPFHKKSIAEQIYAVIHKEPRLLSRVDSSISKDLEVVTHKAMSKVPAKRFASAGEFLGELKRLERGKPIRSRSSSRRERLRTWFHGARTHITWGLTVLAIASAVAWTMLYLSKQKDRKTTQGLMELAVSTAQKGDQQAAIDILDEAMDGAPSEMRATLFEERGEGTVKLIWRHWASDERSKALAVAEEGCKMGEAMFGTAAYPLAGRLLWMRQVARSVMKGARSRVGQFGGPFKVWLRDIRQADADWGRREHWTVSDKIPKQAILATLASDVPWKSLTFSPAVRLALRAQLTGVSHATGEAGTWLSMLLAESIKRSGAHLDEIVAACVSARVVQGGVLYSGSGIRMLRDVVQRSANEKLYERLEDFAEDAGTDPSVVKMINEIAERPSARSRIIDQRGTRILNDGLAYVRLALIRIQPADQTIHMVSQRGIALNLGDKTTEERTFTWSSSIPREGLTFSPPSLGRSFSGSLQRYTLRVRAQMMDDAAGSSIHVETRSTIEGEGWRWPPPPLLTSGRVGRICSFVPPAAFGDERDVVHDHSLRVLFVAEPRTSTSVPWDLKRWRAHIVSELSSLARDFDESRDQIQLSQLCTLVTQLGIREALPLLREIRSSLSDPHETLRVLLAKSRLLLDDESVLSSPQRRIDLNAQFAKLGERSDASVVREWLRLRASTEHQEIATYLADTLKRSDGTDLASWIAKQDEKTRRGSRTPDNFSARLASIHWFARLLMGVLLVTALVLLFLARAIGSPKGKGYVPAAWLVLIGLIITSTHVWMGTFDLLVDAVGYAMAAWGCYLLGVHAPIGRELRSAKFFGLACIFSLGASFLNHALVLEWLVAALCVAGVYYMPCLMVAILEREHEPHQPIRASALARIPQSLAIGVVKLLKSPRALLFSLCMGLAFYGIFVLRNGMVCWIFLWIGLKFFADEPEDDLTGVGNPHEYLSRLLAYASLVSVVCIGIATYGRFGTGLSTYFGTGNFKEWMVSIPLVWVPFCIGAIVMRVIRAAGVRKSHLRYKKSYRKIQSHITARENALLR